MPPRMTKQIGGRKSDVLDCQWIWQLMSYGPWRGVFRGGLLSGMKTIPTLPLNLEVFGTFAGQDLKPHQADHGSEGRFVW